jgi:xylan 1,4-beta-xylosidase
MHSWMKHRRGKLLGLMTALLTLVHAHEARAESPLELRIDFARTNGTLRALHGINRGPRVAGGFIDLTNEHRALGIPFTRLHDSQWPGGNVVDIHAVFPDFTRDPEKAESYDFLRTDEYLDSIRRTGAQMVYRLGESIEHETLRKHVHPPRDLEKWTRICLGVIRHYNEGWGNGARHDIRYWEIWNEPENRPVMWSGTDEDYFQLYRVTSRAIRTEFPQLKLGGPAVGYSGQFVNGQFLASEFVTNFLTLCRRESLPLDFFSWHCYTDDPAELVQRARAIRQLLDRHGFTNTESHLNEWNFLPGNTWKPIGKTSGTPESRQRFYEEMASPAGAAFTAAALMQLQDAPLDMANFFHGANGPFGLFNEHGVRQKNYFAVLAFNTLLRTPRRVVAVAPASQLTVAAGINAAATEANVLISNPALSPALLRLVSVNLPWSGGARVTVRVVDDTHSFTELSGVTVRDGVMEFSLRRSSVALVTWRKTP